MATFAEREGGREVGEGGKGRRERERDREIEQDPEGGELVLLLQTSFDSNPLLEADLRKLRDIMVLGSWRTVLGPRIEHHQLAPHSHCFAFNIAMHCFVPMLLLALSHSISFPIFFVSHHFTIFPLISTDFTLCQTAFVRLKIRLALARGRCEDAGQRYW